MNSMQWQQGQLEFNRKAARLIGWICLLLLVLITAGHWLNDPLIVGGPAIESIEPVGGKMTQEQKLEWQKEKNRHKEFNREHPGPLGQFFAGIYDATLGPALGIMGLVRAAPYVIWGLAILAGVLILAKIYRTIRH